MQIRVKPDTQEKEHQLHKHINFDINQPRVNAQQLLISEENKGAGKAEIMAGKHGKITQLRTNWQQQDMATRREKPIRSTNHELHARNKFK